MTARDQGRLPFASPPRRRGPHERGLDESLRAWRKLDHLTGPGNAARRAVLRELARNADAALTARDAGDATAYSYAVTSAQYRAALDDYAPPMDPTRDPHADDLDAQAEADIAAALAADRE